MAESVHVPDGQIQFDFEDRGSIVLDPFELLDELLTLHKANEAEGGDNIAYLKRIQSHFQAQKRPVPTLAQASWLVANLSDLCAKKKPNSSGTTDEPPSYPASTDSLYSDSDPENVVPST